ncbi:MAG TPA: hypothetical protein VNZ49_05930 [Bacteroidia bacterium]|jgi:hypothetical protein|nr:hypothetical protein [Bacteroidia bacterium]
METKVEVKKKKPPDDDYLKAISKNLASVSAGWLDMAVIGM